MPKVSSIISSVTEMTELCDVGSKACESRKKQNDEDKVKFRCDFTSTQTKVMLTRGWIQVNVLRRATLARFAVSRNPYGNESTASLSSFLEIVDPKDNSWHLWWCETGDALRQVLNGDRKKLRPHQRVSHFRNHYELTRKNYLCRNLKRYKKVLMKAEKTAEAQICDSMPVTFELPSDYRMFVEEYHKQQGATWIVKPAAKSRGIGIFLFRKLKDLAEWKSREAKATSQQPGIPPETYVVQRYIDNPYLVTGSSLKA